jgi:LPS O-antigen subunit length determinant protein (WzzB/FepE family)
MDENRNYNNIQEEEEIDIIAIVKRLWSKRKVVIYSTLVAMALGLVVAITSKEEFTASCTFVPQVSNKSVGGSMSALASMAGINLGGGAMAGQTLSPKMYTKIIENFDFRRELIHMEILDFESIDKTISLYEYMTNKEYNKPTVVDQIKKYTIGLPFVVLKAIRGEEPETTIPASVSGGDELRLYSNKEFDVIKRLGAFLTLAVNDKEGSVDLTVVMPEAIPAAQFASAAVNLLQKYVTNFKIEKAKDNYNFIEKQRDEAKVEYEQVQKVYADFRDANRNITTATARIRQEQLQNLSSIATSKYMELEKQLVQAGVQVAEDTPIFTEVKPVSVPNKKSKPKRIQILAGFIFMGIILGAGLILGLDYLKSQGSPWPKNWSVEEE